MAEPVKIAKQTEQKDDEPVLKPPEEKRRKNSSMDVKIELVQL